jgi:hypothetical protein
LEGEGKAKEEAGLVILVLASVGGIEGKSVPSVTRKVLFLFNDN